MKGMERSGDGSEGDYDASDAIAAQVLANSIFFDLENVVEKILLICNQLGTNLKVRRLAMEVRQLASSRHITVMNGVSGGM